MCSFSKAGQTVGPERLRFGNQGPEVTWDGWVVIGMAMVGTIKKMNFEVCHQT